MESTKRARIRVIRVNFELAGNSSYPSSRVKVTSGKWGEIQGKVDPGRVSGEFELSGFYSKFIYRRNLWVRPTTYHSSLDYE